MHQEHRLQDEAPQEAPVNGAEILSFDALNTEANVDEATIERRERAREARQAQLRHAGLVAELTRLAHLYRRWHIKDAALVGPQAEAAEKALIIRTPVPAVIQTADGGGHVFIQYARGRDSVICENCKQQCPKEGRKFLVVVAPRGLWCPVCAHKGAVYLGRWGLKQRRKERSARRLAGQHRDRRTVNPAR